MKKILIITLEYPPKVGGIASYVKNMAAHLSPEDVLVYAPAMPGDREYDAKFPWLVARKKPLFLLFWPRWLKMYFQVKKLVKTAKIEEIYVHHALPGGYVAYFIRKTLKVPYTLFFHGTDLEMALKHKRRKLKIICAKARQIIVNSEFLKTKLVAKIDCDRVRVVNPAVGDIFFEPVSHKEVDKIKSSLSLHGKKVMLSVARLSEGKGFPYLLGLLPKISREVPNLVWLIVGDGPKRDELALRVADSGCQSIVRFVGYQEYEKLPPYYAVADVFVLLTHRDEETEEGWGTVFLEAAAMGLPVVAGRVGGVEEAVEHGQTGFVVDAADDETTVKIISDLLLDKNKAWRVGAAGRARAEREFRWREQINKIKN